MPKMSRTQTIAAMADATGMKKTEVKAFMEKLFDMAVKEVKKNGEFVLGTFGKLVKVHRKERMGRNPATGATIKIPAKIVVKFRLAKAAKDALK